MNRVASAAWHIALIVAMLVFWQWAVASPRAQFLFGSPALIWSAAQADFITRSFWNDVFATVFVALTGLLAGTLVGGVVGMMLWVSPWVARFSKPYVLAAASIPIFALAPMLIIWFGIGFAPKIFMVGIAVALLVLVTTYNAAVRAEMQHGDWMQGLVMSRRESLRLVIIPVMTADVLQSAANNVGVAIVATFIGEFVISQAGLGHYILRAGGIFDVPRVLFGLAVLIVVSVVLSTGFGALARRLTGMPRPANEVY